MTESPAGRTAHRALAVLAIAGTTLAGCAGDVADAGSQDDAAGVTGTVTVFATASLTDVIRSVADEFEAEHPHATVVLNLAGSSALAAQINEGAPADVFASANPVTMASVTDAGNAAGTPRVLVRNQLVIAVAGGNPLGIGELADLADPELKVAICAEQVPCGAAANLALAAAGVTITPVTLEQDVRATLSRVRLGEVDAALVYRTDTAAAADVDAVEFPESAAAVNDYPVVVLAEAPNPVGARAFVDYLRSEEAAAAFTAAGFQLP